MSLRDQYIDNLNYYSDSRNRPTVKFPKDLAYKWEICHECNGEGRYTNPAIDAGGLSMDRFDDPDFMEDYMGGTYDVTCSCCGGSGKIKVVDEDNCDPEALQEYRDEQEARSQAWAEERAERLVGA